MGFLEGFFGSWMGYYGENKWTCFSNTKILDTSSWNTDHLQKYAVSLSLSRLSPRWFKRTINVEIVWYGYHVPDFVDVQCPATFLFDFRQVRVQQKNPLWIHAVRFEGVRSWFLQHTIWLVWNYRGYRQRINLSTEHNDQPSSLLQPIFGQIKFLHFWVIGPICKDEMAGEVVFKQRYG